MAFKQNDFHGWCHQCLNYPARRPQCTGATCWLWPNPGWICSLSPTSVLAESRSQTQLWRLGCSSPSRVGGMPPWSHSDPDAWGGVGCSAAAFPFAPHLAPPVFSSPFPSYGGPDPWPSMWAHTPLALGPAFSWVSCPVNLSAYKKCVRKRCPSAGGLWGTQRAHVSLSTKMGKCLHVSSRPPFSGCYFH